MMILVMVIAIGIGIHTIFTLFSFRAGGGGAFRMQIYIQL